MNNIENSPDTLIKYKKIKEFLTKLTQLKMTWTWRFLIKLVHNKIWKRMTKWEV